MNLELVTKIADAVLYEGYILYPYRASAVKNQHRFNFGALVPRAYSEHQGGSEAWTMRTECLIEGDQPTIDVRVRFLHLVSREVFRLLATDRGDTDDGARRFEPVPSLKVAGSVYQSWQEAVEREVAGDQLRLADLFASPRKIEFAFEAEETSEMLREADATVGKLVRRQHSVQGIVTVAAEPQPHGLTKISVEVENTTKPREGVTEGLSDPHPGDVPRRTSRVLDTSTISSRDEALLRSLASTHTLLGVCDGQFISLLDPPESFAEMAVACNNVGTWPVLVGHQGQRDTMLSSPIILYDYPQVAPESDGDFFDAMEIDEMLALRVMTLTDDEKREMQNLDDRARQILERTEALPPEQWQKLHGAIRGLKTIS